MSSRTDHYAVLQVNHSAEPIVIEAAYRRLARKYHPDVDKSPTATQHMKDINEAYRILSNPSLRAEYDRSFSYSESPRASFTKSTVDTTIIKEKPKTTSWWKWLLVIPAWPFGFVVPGMVFRFIGGIFVGEDTLHSIWLDMVNSGIGGYCAVIFPAKLAPKWKRGISIVSGFIVALVGGIGLLAVLITWKGWGQESITTILSLVVTLIAAGWAVYGFRDETS